MSPGNYLSKKDPSLFAQLGTRTPTQCMGRQMQTYCMNYKRDPERHREIGTELGLDWFAGGAWGQGGAPADVGGRKRVRSTRGCGAQGTGEARVVMLALTTSLGQDSDTS